jgi:RNA polymerase sigma-70 factor (ECF subfamily)
MSVTDEQILNLMAQKKTLNQGLKMLMDSYQSKLYNHIMNYVRDHDDADDVLQNTFIKIYRNIDKFEGRSNLYTWIFRIATNEAITHLEVNKLKSKRVENINGMEYKFDIKADVNLSGDYIRSVLHKAIDELPPQQKNVFSLRYFNEMSYSDMAEVLGLTEGALKANYHHAVKKIENYLSQLSINAI